MIENRLSIILTLGCIIGVLGLMLKTWGQSMEVYIPALATLIAAFSGVWLANLLQNKNEEKKRINENLVATNKAINTLFQIMNNYHGYEHDIINHAKNTQIPWLEMKPTPRNNLEKFTFSINELAFLFDSKHADLLRELQFTEKTHNKVLELIEQHREVRTETLELLEACKIGDKSFISDIAKCLKGKEANLQSLSESIVKIVCEELPKTKDLYLKFRGEMREYFPGRRLVKLIPFEKPNSE